MTTAATTIQLRTAADIDQLSYYTVCKLSDCTHFVFPSKGLPAAIAQGKWKGALKVDALGNFISFE